MGKTIRYNTIQYNTIQYNTIQKPQYILPNDGVIAGLVFRFALVALDEHVRGSGGCRYRQLDLSCLVLGVEIALKQHSKIVKHSTNDRI